MADTSTSGFPCFHCPQAFAQQSALASHVLSEHMGCKEEEESNSEGSKYAEDQEYDCIQNIHTEMDVKEEGHDSTTDGDDKTNISIKAEDVKDFIVTVVQCSRCGLELSDYVQLKAHTETVHLGFKPKKAKSPKTPLSVHKCQHCLKCFAKESDDSS